MGWAIKAFFLQKSQEKNQICFSRSEVCLSAADDLARQAFFGPVRVNSLSNY